MNASLDLDKAMPAHSALRDWLIERSLPLWSEAGWDRRTGLFVERLDGLGRPLPELPRRLMVQARQIYSFSVAARRGWSQSATQRVERTADAMIRSYYRRDGSPGWVFSVDRSGTPVNPRRDFYTLSFVLLALAKFAEVCDDRRAIALADETLRFMDDVMAHPGGGFVDGLPLPPDGQLRQNPHMHLLEAVLALHVVKPHGDYLDRAQRIVSLFDSRFLQGRPPVLAEFFDPDWTARGGPDIPFEPGHHFEWAWLLTRYADLSGRAIPEAAGSLWSSATDVGLGPGRVIYDEVSLGRGAIQRSTRLWPYCEAAKAACRFSSSRSVADSFVASLHERFLMPACPGSWIDHFDSSGTAKTTDAPASSLYHICCAADVLEQHASRPDGEEGSGTADECAPES